MVQRSLAVCLCVTLSLSFLARSVCADEAFRLKDGDRVVFLGDALVEQAQYSGWIETALTSAFPDVHVQFRNIGWSGDTPAGDSRNGLSLVQAGREDRDEGWRQLQKQIRELQPSVVFIGYGMASSLGEGNRYQDDLDESSVSEFVVAFQRLVDFVRETNPNVRFVLLSPIQPEPSQIAERTDRFRNSIRTLAENNDAAFIDLWNLPLDESCYQDPVHLTEQGYRTLAAEIDSQLLGESTSAGRWQTSPQTESLRQAILRKNEWWFHRSRPANMAYVFGFRKGEQGQNAVEIPKFDPLIAEEEKRIAQLRSLEVVRVEPPKIRTESAYAEFEPQPTPEFTVADGWEVSLWAENPLLNKPVHMNFDPQGRLWVASSEAYPMIEVGQTASDKIIVLADTNGDGTADSSTVFADDLLIPTGVLPGEGGVYVTQSTDLLFLKDTDGDGQSDSKTRVLSGFGTEDTHHNLHTPVWGPDGQLYMNQSVYTRTDAETPHGVMRLKAGGCWRYDPHSMRMHVFFRGLWNPWGHQFDRNGQSFVSDGAGFNGLAWAFPGAIFNPTPRAKRQLDLISPGRYPKFASAEILYGDTFPEDFQGTMVTCDFRANRVTRFSLQDDGAGFVSTAEDDLLRTSAATFRPIDVKQGPDGAIYIADWSNPIINHGEVDFRDPRRDRIHGRIWKLRWKGATPQSTQDLTQLSTNSLLSNLLSKDRFIADQSRRVLAERDGIEAERNGWVAGLTKDSDRLKAVWLQSACHAPDYELILDLMDSPDASIRAAAVRALSVFHGQISSGHAFLDPETGTTGTAWIKNADNSKRLWLAIHSALDDQSPRVRLEAICLTTMIDPIGKTIRCLDVLNHPVDRFIEFALAEYIDSASQSVMESLATETRPEVLEFVLTHIEPNRATQFMQDFVDVPNLSGGGDGNVVRILGVAGTQNQLDQLFTKCLTADFDDLTKRRSLRAILNAQRRGQIRPPADRNEIVALISEPDPQLSELAIQLAGRWKVTSSTEAILADARDSGNVLVAIESLKQIGGTEALAALLELGNSPAVAELSTPLLSAIVSIDSEAALPTFLSMLSRCRTESEAFPIWTTALQSPKFGALLVEKLENPTTMDPYRNEMTQPIAIAGVRAARQSSTDQQPLIDRLLPLANMALVSQEMTASDISELIAKVASEGDPHAGEYVYLRENLQCVQCHAIGGVGSNVGPDMTSLGASAPLDYIIESLYKPNAKIKEGYHAVVVATEDGQVVSGIEIAADDATLTLRTATNEIIQLDQEEIIEKKPGQSLMPMGVIDRLSSAEQVNLIAFLARLGKPGDFDATQSNAARQIDVFAGTHRFEQSGSQSLIDGNVVDGWVPLQTPISGIISADRVGPLVKQPIHIALVHVYLRTPISLATDGSVDITLEGIEDSLSKAWIDGQPVSASKTGQIDQPLPKGEHTLLLRLDARALPKGLKILLN
jgi:putative heme-binding domain-containing protein